MTDAALAFTIRLDMKSDWAVSSGGGRQGSIDSLVERDADGLPYVPATTLRGIWRDAAEQAAFALGGDWPRLVDHVFGSQPNIDARGVDGDPPIPSRLDVADLRFPPGLRQAFRDGRADKDGHRRPDRSALRAALCIIKPGVAIEPRSGRAKTDFLRFEEIARQGAVLEAEGELLLSGDAKSDRALAALAIASASLVDRIGGNRRRGSGRCVMTVKAKKSPEDGLPADADAAIAILETIAQPEVPKVLAPPPHAPSFAAALATDFNVVALDVEILTPTVVAKAVLGNVVQCLDYIPGTLLLAGVASLLAETIGQSAMSAAFANGDIRVLPAYPVVAGRRGLPAPLIMERLKDDNRGPDGKGLLRIRPQQTDMDDNVQYKSCRGQFIAFEAGPPPQIAFGKVEPVVRTHNTVQDEVQKPTEEVGGVFTYEAIPAGSRLRSEIWLREDIAAKDVLGKLTDRVATISIGRAKKAGYGTVKLTGGAVSTVPGVTGADASGFKLLLASDLLLPATPGKDTSPQKLLSDAISRATGVAASVAGGDIRTGRTEGWTARWRLPRPSYVMLRAGSTVFVVAGGASFSSTQRTMLQRQGLGLRRSEGFGQVLVDPDCLTTELGKAVELEGPKMKSDGDLGRVAAAIDQAFRDFACVIEDAALQGAIRLRAEQAVATESGRKQQLGWTIDSKPDGKMLPNMSQLGALRSVMRGLTDEADLERACKFIDSIAKTDRRERWGDVAIGKLQTLLKKPDTVWTKLGIAEDTALSDLLIVRSSAAIMRDPALCRFAIVNLLHAAMRAHKRSAETPRSPADHDHQTAEA